VGRVASKAERHQFDGDYYDSRTTTFFVYEFCFDSVCYKLKSESIYISFFSSKGRVGLGDSKDLYY